MLLIDNNFGEGSTLNTYLIHSEMKQLFVRQQ